MTNLLPPPRLMPPSWNSQPPISRCVYVSSPLAEQPLATTTDQLNSDSAEPKPRNCGPTPGGGGILESNSLFKLPCKTDKLRDKNFQGGATCRLDLLGGNVTVTLDPILGPRDHEDHARVTRSFRSFSRGKSSLRVTMVTADEYGFCSHCRN